MVVITGVALLAITAGPLTPVAAAIATETGVAATTCGAAGTAAASTAAGTAAGTAAVAGSSGTAVAAGTTLAASNPVGWAVLGKTDDGTTYDCWKAVIHDQSTEPSNGMLLRDVMNHPNVSKVSITTGSRPELPHIVIENIWKEEFEIEYYILKENNNLVCHAKAI